MKTKPPTERPENGARKKPALPRKRVWIANPHEKIVVTTLDKEKAIQKKGSGPWKECDGATALALALFGYKEIEA